MTSFSPGQNLRPLRDNRGRFYRNLPIFYRDPLLVGNDALIEPLGDLQVTHTGDLALQTGSESIVDNLLRRMHTPPEGYGRWVRDGDEVTLLDEDYGNPAYLFLSTPFNVNDAFEIRQALRAAAENEPRINIINVQILEVDYRGSITVRITYRILDNAELLTVERNILTKAI